MWFGILGPLHAKEVRIRPNSRSGLLGSLIDSTGCGSHRPRSVKEVSRRLGGVLAALVFVLFACSEEPASPLDISEFEGAAEGTTADDVPADDSSTDSPAPPEVEGAFAYAIGDSETRELLALNPDTGVIGTLTTLDDATEAPSKIWAVGDELWMASMAQLFRLDTTGAMLGVLELEGVNVMAFGDGAVWVEGGPISAPPRIDPYFSRLDPDTLEVVSSIEPAEFDHIGQIVFGGGSLWVTWIGRDQEIERRDPDTLATTETIPATAGNRETEFKVESLAWGEDSLWAAGPLAHDIARQIAVVRIAADGTVQSQIVLPDFEGVGGAVSGSRGIAVGLGAVWVVDERGHQVARVDPATNTEIARIEVTSDSDIPTSGLHVASGRVWWRVLNTLYAIDPASNEATPVLELPTESGVFVRNLVGPIAFPGEEG